MAGNPFTATVSGTSVPSAIVGYRLGGIAAPVVTHATNAFVNADRIGALGAGFAGSSQPLAAVCRRAEAAAAAAVRDAGEKVAAHRVRQRNVGLRVGADEHERRAQVPDLGAAERLHDLRARVRRAAAIEEARMSRARAARRSSLPTRPAPRSRARSRSTSPPGSANRRFRSITRAAMFGLLPSHTMRPDSSWLNPSLMNARRNVPDCELPSEIAQRTMPATGFGVPESSARS